MPRFVRWSQMFRVRGWRRRLYRRVIRLQGSPHAIARGMAVGVFVAFVLPPGLQLFIAIPLALLLRGNVITAALGTVATNLVTALPCYYFTCRVGEEVLQRLGFDVALLSNFREQLAHALRRDPRALIHLVREVILCWVVGGLIVGIAAAVPAYYLTYLAAIEVRRLHESTRSRHARRRAAAQAKRGSTGTAEPAPPRDDHPAAPPT